jgi:integrase
LSGRKRANGEGSVFFHSGKRRWCAKITLPGGKRVSLYAATRQEASRRMVDALKSREQGTLVVVPKMTLHKFLSQWLAQSVRPNVRPWTYKGYEVIVRVHLAPEIGHLSLTDLNAQHVQALMNKKIAGGLSPKTVQYIRGVLRTALNEAIRWELVSRNVASLVRGPRSERKPITPFGPADAMRLLEAAQSDRLGALYSVALALGLRQGEALGLTWSHVDFDRAVLRVEQQLQRVDGKLTLVPLKTSQSRRTLPMPDIISDGLRLHQGKQQRERRAAGSRWQDTGLVFTTPIGTGLDGPNVTKGFQRLLARSSLEKRRFHDLRHSCASLLLAQNVSPRVVMEILGHSQISLTMNTYTHVLPDLKREAVMSIDAILTHPVPRERHRRRT